MDEPTLEVSEILSALRRNARVVAELVADVSESQARWRPEADKWSILEVVSHLADEEVEDFRARIDSTLHRPGEAWSPVDPEGWVVERRYGDGVLADALERFLRAREESVAWLEGLEDVDWRVSYAHPRLGSIRAGDLLTSWVAHDHIHIRQLNRLHREFLLSALSGFLPGYAGRW